MLVKICPVGAQFSNADGRTNMTKLTIPFHKFENAPEIHMKNKNKGDSEWNGDRTANPGRARSPPSATAVYAPSAVTATVAACSDSLNRRQSCPYTDLAGICEIEKLYDPVSTGKTCRQQQGVIYQTTWSSAAPLSKFQVSTTDDFVYVNSIIPYILIMGIGNVSL
jgi:hypothetical protein